MKEEKGKVIVNKLILIGNGFDLSLGLKTSYKDFLLWFLKTEIKKAIDNDGRQEAPFPKHKGRYNDAFEEYNPLVVFGFSENQLFDVLVMRNYKINTENLLKTTEIKDVLRFTETYDINIKQNNPKGIFDKILKDSISKWVDIEGAYFDSLKEILKGRNKNLINELNEDFEFIAAKLEEYLYTINYNKDNLITQTSHTLRKLIKPVETSELINVSNDSEVETNISYFLNFNYTNTVYDMVSNYFSLQGKSNYEINHIHGELKSGENPIIFGFGDEMDDEYSVIEKLNDNRFLHFIKSFRYSKNNNYRNLLRFLNSDNYQVVVYGHSCGLSDRIMLNEIFEHENCKSIKIHYYKNGEGDDDFMSKNMEISRHFKSNKLMRQKIVEKSDSDLINQPRVV